MSTGYTVNSEELRSYASTLAGNTDVVAEIDGLVSTSDVGDESWGVVGLFVKGEYSQMIDDLHEVLGDMKAGYQSAANKFNKAAAGYEEAEASVRDMLHGILTEIENAPSATG